MADPEMPDNPKAPSYTVHIDGDIARRLKWIAIGVAVLLALLVAALVGMAYGLLSLIQTTKIEQGQFLVNKDSGKPVVTGGALLDVSGVTYGVTGAGATASTTGTYLVDVGGVSSSYRRSSAAWAGL